MLKSAKKLLKFAKKVFLPPPCSNKSSKRPCAFLPDNSHGIAHFVDEEEPFVNKSWSAATNACARCAENNETSAYCKSKDGGK